MRYKKYKWNYINITIADGEHIYNFHYFQFTERPIYKLEYTYIYIIYIHIYTNVY